MTNINQIISTIYKNIQIFYKYRNHIFIDDIIEDNELHIKIQSYKYFVLRSVANEGDINIKQINKIVNNYNNHKKSEIKLLYIVINYPNSEYTTKRVEFNKLLNLFPYPNKDIIIINSSKINARMFKYIKTLNVKSSNKIYLYTYALFKNIIPEYCLAPKYKILTNEEIEELKKFYIDPLCLSKIYESDPQMIWIGAKSGDVIKYEYLSEVTIKGIGYSLVIED